MWNVQCLLSKVAITWESQSALTCFTHFRWHYSTKPLPPNFCKHSIQALVEKLSAELHGKRESGRSWSYWLVKTTWSSRQTVPPMPSVLLVSSSTACKCKCIDGHWGKCQHCTWKLLDILSTVFDQV